MTRKERIYIKGDKRNPCVDCGRPTYFTIRGLGVPAHPHDCGADSGSFREGQS